MTGVKSCNEDFITTLISNLVIEKPPVKTCDYKHHSISFTDIYPSASEHNVPYCHVCGEKSELYKCSQCHVLTYCSKEHQLKDWSHHKSQCRTLSYAYDDMQALKQLTIPKDADLLKVKNTFLSFHGITNWYVLWKHLQCTLYNTDIFQKLISELLSWSLILVNAVHSFKLDSKPHLQIHILGANDSYVKLGLFTYFLKFFPLPDTEIFLIGPKLSYSVSPICYKNSAGRDVAVSCISDVFDQDNENFSLPDLILAYHPDLCDESYDWKPTLLYIVSKEIPSVFTMSSKAESDDVLSMLRCDLFNTNILFHGHSQFPSMLKKYEREGWNKYKIKQMNNYWVGFHGDLVTSEVHARYVREMVSQLCNLTNLEMNRISSGMPDEFINELGMDLIPSLFQLQFSEALESFNEGLKSFEKNHHADSFDSFQKAIRKSILPTSDSPIGKLKGEEEKQREKMRSLLASSYMYLGLLSKQQNDVVTAIKELKRAVSTDRTFHVAFYNLGILYQEHGDYDGMEEAFSEATKLSPQDSLSWIGLGDALYGKGKFTEAENAYEHANKSFIY